jgi:hypothetical protein
MWDPGTSRVHETSDVIWLKRIFYETIRDLSKNMRSHRWKLNKGICRMQDRLQQRIRLDEIVTTNAHKELQG